MKAFDCAFLSLLFHGHLIPPGAPFQENVEKAERLFVDLKKRGERGVIPMPALSELLVRIDDHEAFLGLLGSDHFYKIVDFDELGAIEIAAVTRKAIQAGNKRGLADPRAFWQKVKLDRQIVALAKVWKADTIYTDDRGVVNIAREFGIDAKTPADLFVAPTTRRPRLPRDIEDSDVF